MERTLLLLDDEENILNSLQRALRRDGYHILKTTSAREALQLIENNAVGVILSDQRMPEMTGVEFLSKTRERCPQAVRMILSGYTELTSVTDAINRGWVYKFLTKPWDDELLRANVLEAFERFEMVQENERLSIELKQANADLQALNQALARSVEEKTQQSLFSQRVAQVAQEVLEHLPLAIIGVGEDGLIALANRKAHACFAGDGNALPGLALKDALPALAGEQTAVVLQNGQALSIFRQPFGAPGRPSGIIIGCIDQGLST